MSSTYEVLPPTIGRCEDTALQNANSWSAIAFAKPSVSLRATDRKGGTNQQT